MRNHIHKPAAILLSVLFCGLLLVTLIGTFFHWDFYANQENRCLAVFPNIGKEEVGKIPREMDSFFDDHFGFRNTFIYQYNRLRNKWFKISPVKVIIGKDNWLFYNDRRIRSDYERKHPLSATQLRQWQHVLESRQAWLQEHGCRYVFVVAPNKSSVYPEYLPEYIKIADRPSRLDQFIQQMKSNSTVRVIDLRPVLINAKQNTQVYHRTDTHWNDNGAWVAYSEIIKNIHNWFPELQIRPRNEWIEQTDSAPGDLASMSGMANDYPETCAVLRVSDAQIPVSLPVILPVDHGWKWQVGDPPEVRSNTNGVYSLLVFHDSFVQHGLRLPLSLSFSHSVFFHMLPQQSSLSYLTELYKPDLVMEEMLEKYLVNVPENVPEWEAAWQRHYGKH